MSWVQIRVATQKPQVELIEALLLNAGALSITLQDNADEPILEPELGSTPIWQHTSVIGLFSDSSDAKVLAHNLQQDCQQMLDSQDMPRISVHKLADKNWLTVWQDDYHPMQFGHRLWVCPSWTAPPDADAINLKLDPGLAFGTGTHPTTALCLQHLEGNIHGGERVLDFGCGSGILGIAAVLLGAQSFTGIDIDPQAISASEENAKRNNLSPKQYYLSLPEQAHDLQYDWVIANILATPLKQMAEKLANYCQTGGQIMLSGLLESQAEDMLTVYAKWFELNPIQRLDEWILITGTKR